VNSPSNPAARGSIISVFANSAGIWQPSLGDGLVLPTAIRTTFLTSQVTFNGTAGIAIYAANSPGSVTALWQINVVIPTNTFPSANTTLRLLNTQNQTTQRITIATK
jgi:uncharacterized protein (TIGR03437 family)